MDCDQKPPPWTGTLRSVIIEDLNKFFITTAIPYVNARPHLGFVLELIQADTIARWRRELGDDVFFVTGTDENALKNLLAAKEEGISTQQLVDKNAAEFKGLKELFNFSWDDFIRTTEERHIRGAQKFWRACSKDIYKKKYSGLYCVGCEEFKTAKDLVNNTCEEHPNLELEQVEEENYFFALSRYQDKIRKLIESNQLKIIPETRKNEALSFINQGLQDFSISRSKERARGWGIPVPGDDSQIIYVWFDALTNYINALDYADDGDNFKKYWSGGDQILHVIGKGILRFHAVYWSAMLLSAGLPLPKQIFVHGYLTVDGKKISKSLGNIIDPQEAVAKFGAEAIRYYLLREASPFDDSDFTYAKVKERYNADLANGLGNFVARVLALAEKINIRTSDILTSEDLNIEAKRSSDVARLVNNKLSEFKFHEALAAIWDLIAYGDKFINDKKLWLTSEDPNIEAKRSSDVATLIALLEGVANLLEPFLPNTAEKIKKHEKTLLFPRA